MLKTFVYIALTLICVPALAQDRIDADRPGETRSPELVKGNHLQAEFGFRKEKLSPGVYLYQHPMATVRYGLFNALEFRLEMISQSIRDKSSGKDSYGLRPLEVGLKAKILPEYKGFPSVAVMGHLGLPNTSSQDYYHKRLPIEFRTLFGNTINKKFRIQYNAGVKWAGSEREARWMYSISPMFQVSEKIDVFLEHYAFLQKTISAQHYLDGGFETYFTRNLKFDLSAGVGLSEHTSPYFVAAGLSFRFPL